MQNPTLAFFPILTGPTASGKTELALELAEDIFQLTQKRVEIINADSLCFFRGLSIGTAKPSEEQQKKIRHHFLDWKEPNESINAGDFKKSVLELIENNRDTLFLIVGGSGFYLKALRQEMWKFTPQENKEMSEYRENLRTEETQSLYNKVKQVDPDACLSIEFNDRYRLLRALEIAHCTPFKFSELQKVKITPDPRFPLNVVHRADERECLSRIESRTKEMLKCGWIEEVKAIREKFGNVPPLKSVGYLQILEFLDGISPQGRKLRGGRNSMEGLEDEINLATKQLVKQQMKWFRTQPEARFFSLPDQKHELKDTLKTYLLR